MNVIGIYPGSFQPPHKGHLQAFDYLKQYTGDNSFVTTTDQVEMPNSPLSFQDKQQIWTRHGVPIDKVILVKDPYKAVEITKKFGSDRTAAIFAMTKTQADKVLKSYGGYFQPFKGMDQEMNSLDKTAYILTVPDADTAVHKQFTPEKIRQAFSSQSLTDDKKKSFFKQVFGWYDISLYDLMTKKFKEASVVKERLNESNTMIYRRALRPIVREIMIELAYPTAPDNNVTTTSDTGVEASPADIAKAEKEKKIQKDKELKAKEIELKTIKKEREFHKQKVDMHNRITVPGLTKNIQALKKTTV